MHSFVNRFVERGVLLSSIAMMMAGIGGCSGESGPPLFPVEGTVTLDGLPLPDGYIAFYPTENGLDADTASITDGAFSLQATQGGKRVEITAQRPIPGTLSPLGAPEVEQYIPDRFNKDSKLEAHIAPQARNTLEFRLESD